ncbi:MAG: phage major capsid protein [Chloroflexi bacterium]|nr:phage major capsid protein [Chloroflexota bacterium]
MQVLPDQYHRNVAQMRHYVSVDQDVEYRDSLASRATGVGDSFVQGQQNPTPFGVPVSRVQTMPEDKGLFTNPLNLLMGVQRQVLMEFDKDIRTREYIIVLTARLDFQVEEAEAAVVYNDIGLAL